MNISNDQLESILRQAPKPITPGDLKDKLLRDARELPGTSHVKTTPAFPVLRPSGWSRWWPAFALGAAVVTCVTILAAQQREINRLKRELANPPTGGTEHPGPAKLGISTGTGRSEGSEASQAAEIERLKALATSLIAEIGQLRLVQTENEQLRQQLIAAQGPGFSAEEEAALAQARDKAMAINCVNNLKQFGLSVRVWSLDNDEISPPDIVCMSNELSTTKILVCPADTNRQPAETFATFTTANCSYDYIMPSEKDPSREPDRIMSRCPIHGTVGLADGSVHMAVAKTHPEWIVSKNGKLYLKDLRTPIFEQQQAPK